MVLIPDRLRDNPALRIYDVLALKHPFKSGHEISVLCFSNNEASIVGVDDLEPSLPEEGDTVKSLLWDDLTEAGTVLSIDDQDNAVIKVCGDNKESIKCQIDKLCKVDPKYA